MLVQIGQNIWRINPCGSSISISDNGSVLAIGAKNNDGIFPNWNACNMGHVRIYELITLGFRKQ